MRLGTIYNSASGPSNEDCCFIGHRFVEEWGFKPDTGESWVLHASPPAAGEEEGQVTLLFGVAGWFTGLWRSPAGWVYVADAAGKVHLQRDVARHGTDPDRWEEFTFDAVMLGVWGLNDQFVLAWGKIGKEGRMYRWDGARWSAMPAPGPHVHSVHGIAPDVIYAAGADGLLARWDGTAWHRIVVPTPEDLTAVFAASEDEAYAVGNAGVVLGGSTHGWGKIAQGPGPLHGVAKFKGELWIGAGELGLLRRHGNTRRLVKAKANIHAHEFEAREQLVMSCPGKICGTEDGKDFSSVCEGFLAEALRHRRPLWMEPSAPWPPEDDEE